MLGLEIPAIIEQVEQGMETTARRDSPVRAGWTSQESLVIGSIHDEESLILKKQNTNPRSGEQ
jgi:hypothetical protein